MARRSRCAVEKCFVVDCDEHNLTREEQSTPRKRRRLSLNCSLKQEKKVEVTSSNKGTPSRSASVSFSPDVSSFLHEEEENEIQDPCCSEEKSVPNIKTEEISIKLNSENVTDNLPATQSVKAEVLKDVVAYVEVRSGHFNCTKIFREFLEELGAKTIDKVTKAVTHVVFKEGRKSTYKFAIQQKVHLVSVMWVIACKDSAEWVSEELHPVVVSEAYTSPLVRIRRMKSLDWDKAEETEESIEQGLARHRRKKQLREWRANRGDLFKPTALADVLAKILSEKDNSPLPPMSPPGPRKVLKPFEPSYGEFTPEDNVPLPLARRLFENCSDTRVLEYLKNYIERTDENSTASNAEDGGSTGKPTEGSSSPFKDRNVFSNFEIPDLSSMFPSKDAKKKPGPDNTPGTRKIAKRRTPMKNLPRNSNDGIAVAGKSGHHPENTPNSRKSLDEFKSPKPKCRDIRDYFPKMGQKDSVVLTSFHSKERDNLTQIISSLGGYNVSNDVIKSTSHVVAGDGRRTLNILFALTKGCWILGPDWIRRSQECGKWVDEEPFELNSSFPSAKIFRTERQDFGGSYKSTLFKGFGGIFIAPNSSPPRKDLQNLLTSASADVVKCHRRAKVVLGVALRNCDSLCVVETWALDCITNGKILPVDDYLLL